MRLLFPLLTLMILCCCKHDVSNPPKQEVITVTSEENSNSIYYWKTRFVLNEHEKTFLKDNNIQRLYLRFFDVAIDSLGVYEGKETNPIATVDFIDTIPHDLEVIPTVYITLDALRSIKSVEEQYAQKIITRILAMKKRHIPSELKEVQFDCDWTNSTEQIYFKVCQKAHSLLKKHNITLSATLRLHQLNKPAPPVDRMTLMLYNTGQILDPNTQNSIIDFTTIKPYLEQYNGNYSLPIDFAYPTFSWSVWFHRGRFGAILKTVDFDDLTLYQRINTTTYQVIKDHKVNAHHLKKGDKLRREAPHFSEICKVKLLVEKTLAQKQNAIILYHLDSLNLSSYSKNEITSLYTHPSVINR